MLKRFCHCWEQAPFFIRARFLGEFNFGASSEVLR